MELAEPLWFRLIGIIILLLLILFSCCKLRWWRPSAVEGILISSVVMTSGLLIWTTDVGSGSAVAVEVEDGRG
uniref:Uncharacterized protein n=1 Tax=Cannabis sativa TaxID=3483 RepID=A0A803R1A6_CANSA